MATTRRAVEDVRHVEDMAKKNQIPLRKIAKTKLNAQTVKKPTLFFQVDIYKREREILEVKYK